MGWTIFRQFMCLVRSAVVLSGVFCWYSAALLFAALRYLNEAPYIAIMLLTRSVDSAIADSNPNIQSTTLKSIIGFTSAGTLAYIFRRYLPVFVADLKLGSSGIKLKPELRTNASTPTKAALKSQLEEERAANICIICMDRRKDVIVLECRHMVMCSRCAAIIAQSSGECPICRRAIHDIIQVYYK